MSTFAERRFRSADDVEIYYRDYGDPLSPGVPVVCLTGLTRNSKDFHDLASRLAPRRRVLCMDYRGRGRSAYDPNPENYQPRSYVGDAIAMLTVTNVHRALFVGTSLGGLLTMGIAAALPSAVAGAVLNDVGPQMDTKGIERIASYVGTDVHVPGYEAAAKVQKTQFTAAYPDVDDATWLDMARRIFTEDKQRGGVRLDYDLNIAITLRKAAASGAATPPLWKLYHALREVPVLAIRGVLSDVLSPETFARMTEDMPHLTRLEIGNRGHVPLLDEPDCVTAIDDLIARVEARA
jgi:pimeloyl-ACP methyl ester carboxylesterase